MKRPLAIVGFTLMITLLLVNFIQYKYIIFVALFVAVLYFLSFFIKNSNKRKALNLLFISVISAFVIFILYNNIYVEPIKALNDKEAYVTARLTEKPYENNANFYYTVTTSSVSLENKENSPQNIKFTFNSFTPIDFTYNDSINLKIKFSTIQDEYKDYNYCHNNFINATILNKEIHINKNSNNDIKALLLTCKDTIINNVYNSMPYTQATLANAVLLGDKKNLEQDIKTDFYDTGVSHLIVVSGLHISIIANFVFLSILHFKKNHRFASVFAIISVLLFVVVTGFSVSVVRSGFMLIIMFSGYLFRYKSDSITSIALAGIILCLINPYSMLDVSLLLSFSATLSIILLYKPLKNHLYKNVIKNENTNKILDYLISTCIVSCSVVFATLPITLIYFGEISPYFLFANLLLIYPATCLLICTIFLIIVSFIPIFSIFATMLGFINTIICDYMIFIANFIQSLPYSSVNIDLTFFKIWIIIAIILIGGIFIITKNKNTLKMTIPVTLCILIVLFIFDIVLNTGKTEIEFISCGDGITVVAYKDDNCAVLSCGGGYGNKNIKEEIEKFRNIDLQIIGDKKANKAYAEEMLYKKKIKSVIILDSKRNEKIKEIAYNKQDNIFMFDNYQHIELWDNIEIELLYDDNKLWQYIKCEEETILIAPQNADFKILDDKYYNIDYLVLNNIPKNIDLIKTDKVILSSTIRGIEKMENELKDYLKSKEVSTTKITKQVITK